jgi:hypothetical protein
MRLVEIFDDRQRLEQDRSVAVNQSGKRHHRVDCAVRRLALRGRSSYLKSLQSRFHAK